MDTYIPSGEESAQEQQFLQGLIGNLGAIDAKQSAIPKYATQIFANFGGNYLTLVPNPSMIPIFPFGTSANYSGMCIATSVFDETYKIYEFWQLAGLDASGNPQIGQLSSWWNNPAVDPYQTAYVIRFSPTTNILFDYLSYFRQNWAVNGATQYMFIPKWMKSLVIGARLYNGAGVMDPILIASKSNAKWQSATINSGTTSDSRLFVGNLMTSQDLRNDPQYWNIIHKTLRFTQSVGQFTLYNKAFFPTSLTERQELGKSVVTFDFAYYPSKIGNIPPLTSYRFAINNWDNTYPYDPQSTDVTAPQGYNATNYLPTPLNPPTNNYPNANSTLEVDTVRRWNIPVTLPYTRYFRLIGSSIPTIFNSPISATYGVYYPSDYPVGRPTLLDMGASTDIFKFQPCNYACVTPAPAGLPTPPPSAPLFNSLDVNTMPLIGVDITQPI